MSMSLRVAGRDIKAFTKYFQATKALAQRGTCSDINYQNESESVFKEWLFMSPKEKKWFYDPDNEKDIEAPNRHFVHFMNWNMDKYPNTSAAKVAKKLAPIYKQLSYEEKMYYGSLTLRDYHDYKANDVINKRQELKTIYQDPKELLLLEMILLTKPYKPLSSYQWFARSIKNCVSTTTLNQWKAITNDKKVIFIKRFRLDELRYTYENEIWRTRFLHLDLDKTDINLEEMLKCRLAPEDIKDIAQGYTNLEENIFYYYMYYIILERFLQEGEKSVQLILEEATKHWDKLDSQQKKRYSFDCVMNAESRRSRLKRISINYPEFTEKMILLEDLVEKSQALKNLKIKLKLADSRRDSSEDARIRLIEQIY